MDKRFCIPIDLPRLNDETEQEIIEFASQNNGRFIGWSFINNYVSSVGKQVNLGFSNIRIVDEKETNFFKELLEKNNIKLNYQNLLFALQKSKLVIHPHTDPGRTVTLQYLIKGKAISRFWSMKNFKPDVGYKLKDLTLESEFVIEPHTWYLYNNSAIHSAYNIENERIQLAVVLTYKFKDFEDAKTNFCQILI